MAIARAESMRQSLAIRIFCATFSGRFGAGRQAAGGQYRKLMHETGVSEAAARIGRISVDVVSIPLLTSTGAPQLACRGLRRVVGSESGHLGLQQQLTAEGE